jgi:hypothetical protein
MQVTDSLRRTLKEQDDIRKWLAEGTLPPLKIQSPSISYCLDDQVGEISIAELLSLIDFRVETAFAERASTAPPPARKPARPYELPAATRAAVDHIIKHGNEAELREFLAHKPQHEREAIHARLARSVAV